MWLDTDSDENDEREGTGEPDDQLDLGDESAYWRRRFIILCAGVAAVAVCAWLLPGAHPAAANQSPAASRAALAALAALAESQALPSAAYGSAWASPVPTVPASFAVHPEMTATVKPSSTVKPNSTVKPSSTLAQKKPGQQSTSAAYHPGTVPGATPQSGATPKSKSAKIAACAPADVVLSLFTSQPSYARSARPKFSVYAVSTATAACTLSYGPASVHVVVTSRGHVVWDSAACALAGDPKVRFTLGVPQGFSVTWDHAAKKPAGCGGSLAPGTLGTLEAVAFGPAGESSPVRTFKVVK